MGEFGIAGKYLRIMRKTYFQILRDSYEFRLCVMPVRAGESSHCVGSAVRIVPGEKGSRASSSRKGDRGRNRYGLPETAQSNLVAKSRIVT